MPRIAARRLPAHAAPLARLSPLPSTRAARCLCAGGGSSNDSAAPGLAKTAEEAARVASDGAMARGRVGGVKTPGSKMSMTFTCDVCDTRSTKIFHRHSYEKGTVIVRCPGCENLHLVADNLGWFLDGPEGYNIESILASKGQAVRRAADEDEHSAVEFLPSGTCFADEKQCASAGYESAAATSGVGSAPGAAALEPPAAQPHTQDNSCAEDAQVGRVTLEEVFVVIDGMELSDARR